MPLSLHLFLTCTENIAMICLKYSIIFIFLAEINDQAYQKQIFLYSIFLCSSSSRINQIYFKQEFKQMLKQWQVLYFTCTTFISNIKQHRPLSIYCICLTSLAPVITYFIAVACPKSGEKEKESLLSWRFSFIEILLEIHSISVKCLLQSVRETMIIYFSLLNNTLKMSITSFRLHIKWHH